MLAVGAGVVVDTADVSTPSEAKEEIGAVELGGTEELSGSTEPGGTRDTNMTGFAESLDVVFSFKRSFTFRPVYC